jgi:hypothetical protein
MVHFTNPMKLQIHFALFVSAFALACRLAAPAAAAGESASLPGAAPSGAPADIVVRIGDHSIDRAAFEAEFARARRDTTKKQSDLEARQEFMESLVNRQLLVHAAREKGYFAPDSTRDWMIQGFAESILLTLYREREVRAKIQITPAEVDSFHAKQAELFDLSQIIVATPEEAEAVKARLAAGEDFAALAREVSLDVKTAEKGGKVEPFAYGMTTQSLLRAFETMQPGEIRGPVESEAGYHIFQSHGRKPNPNQKPLSEVRDFIEYRYQIFREMEAITALNAEFRQRYHFTPNWPAVREFSGQFRAAVENTVKQNPGAAREDQEEIAKRSIVLEDRLLAEPVATWDFGRFLIFEDWQFVSELPGLAIVDRRNPHFVVGDAAAKFYREAQAHEARARGWDEEPTVKSEVERKREEIAVTEFYRLEVLAKPTFTAAEERAYYDEHPDQFVVEAQVKLACLQYQADPKAAEDMEKALATKGANPDSLLKDHLARGLIRTQTPEGKWFNEPEHPILYARAEGIQPGEVGRTIDEDGYWTVFIVLDREAGHQAPFDEVQKTVATSLRNIRSDEILKTMLADLRTRYPVWVDPAYVQSTGGSN